jgi:hypothetical protein
MVLIKPPDPASPAASHSSTDTSETRPEMSSSVQPLPVGPPGKFDIDTHAFDDVDALLGNVPARNMVPVPTARPSSPSPTGKAAPRPEPPIGTPPTIVRPPTSKSNPDSQAQTVSQSGIPVSEAHAAIRPAAPTASPSQPPKSAEPTLREKVAAAAAVPQLPVPAAKPATPAGAAPWTADAPPAEPAAEVATETIASSPWQYWAIVSASGVLGVILAITVVAFSLSWFGSNNASQPIARGPDSAPVQPASNPAETKKSGEQPAPVEPAIPEQPAAGADEVKPAKPKPAEVAGNPAATPPAELPPAAPAKPMPPAIPVTPPSNPAVDPLGPTDPPAKPTDLPKPPGTAPGELAKLDDPLQKFDNLIGGGVENPLPEAGAPEPKPATPQLDVEPEEAPSTDLLPKPEPRQIDAAVRLQDVLPGVEIAGAPLADFLQVMQDLSTVPITLRPDGLSMVRLTPITAETTVQWKGESATIAEALRGALQPLGLEAKLEADQVVIDVASPALTPMRLAVKDLTGSDEQKANELAALVTAFVAPDTWTDEEGEPSLVPTKDELQIRQHRLALAQSVLLLEKLRVARGLRPVSRFEAKLFDLATRGSRAKGALATPITLNYSQPTPLLRITERLGKTANVRILIDWQSLAAVGWNPAAEATLSVEQQPLSATLDDLTRRMQLAWRVVDANTIQILSPAALAAHAELEFYRAESLAADEAGGAALVSKIRSALGAQHFRDAGGQGEIHFDVPSKCLLVSLPQPQQRQLAALLLEWQSDLATK